MAYAIKINGEYVRGDYGTLDVNKADLWQTREGAAKVFRCPVSLVEVNVDVTVVRELAPDEIELARNPPKKVHKSKRYHF